MKIVEAQVDRLVGPTHHFGGLGVGNVASNEHAGQISNPKAGALQGLEKMSLVARLGVPQFILPPQQRPRIDWLRRCGFGGSDADVLRRTREEDPSLLSAAMSCSAMWTANAATVAAAHDGASGRPTLTIANLDASLHRSLEPEETLTELRSCLPHATLLHAAIPGGTAMRDEGAANQMRLSNGDGPGLHVFVYGDSEPAPKQYLARQTIAASRAVARLNGLSPNDVFFLKQHPLAIDAGAFHNDVVATSHRDLVLHHELAFYEGDEVLQRLDDSFRSKFGKELRRFVVTDQELPLGDTVRTYLFNSQIIDAAEPGVAPRIICPSQVREHAAARRIVELWHGGLELFSEIHYVDLHESMSGGGGPACLRLRVPLDESDLMNANSAMRWSERLQEQLRSIIEVRYPSTMRLDDLGDYDYVGELEETTKRVRGMILQA